YHSCQSLLLQQRTINGNSSFGTFCNGDSNQQDITRCIAGHANPGHAAFFGDWVAYDAALFIAFAAEPFPQVRALNAACREKKRSSLQNAAVGEANTLQTTLIIALQFDDLVSADLNSVLLQARLNFLRNSCGTICAEDDVCRPLSHHQREPRALVTFSVDPNWFVAVFKAVAIGALMHAPPVKPLDTVYLGDLILEASRDEHFARGGRDAI